mmetsp:Transcript_22577/g.35417  ORF Transcript_22577/g.35417 Transcript_22577/m.35417 type:complete len:91 (+) Transcript_22577:340-612(+)
MGQRSNVAAVKDARIYLGTEECVSSMEQRSNDAAGKDAPIMSLEEKCASSMGQGQGKGEGEMTQQRRMPEYLKLSQRSLLETLSILQSIR